MRLASFIMQLTLASAAWAQTRAPTATSTTRVPTLSATLPARAVITARHTTERLTVHTSRNVLLVKAKLHQQIGPVPVGAALTPYATDPSNYTIGVNRLKGPSGLLHFLSIYHGRWFRWYGYANKDTFIPKEMQQYTIGNPLSLLTFARHINNPEPFLNAPIHMLVADNSWGGTTIVWDRPTTQLVPPGSPAAAFTACAEFDKVMNQLVNFIAFG